MATKKPHEMSNEELLKQEKTLKASVYMLLVTSIFILLIGIFLLFYKKQGFNAFLAIPISFVAIIIINSNLLKEIRKEITSRGL